MFAQTPSQTVGPFFAHALSPSDPDRRIASNDLVGEQANEAAIWIEGRVLDGEGRPVQDALIEIWQADSNGEYPDGSGSFRGFGRAGTDVEGRFAFRTLKPGSVSPGSAPHASAVVFARGMLNHAFTRIYFSDESVANLSDEVLAAVDEDRRETLIASMRGNGDGVAYEFTIRLQGDRETVFFDV